MTRTLALCLFTLALSAGAPQMARAQQGTASPVAVTAAPTSVADAIRHIEASLGPTARIGVMARVEGERVLAATRAGEAFPMASTFKVAVAGAVLHRIERGDLSLDQVVAVTQAERDGDCYPDDAARLGPAPTIRVLLEEMMISSNNLAADKLTAAVGGPRAVTRWLGEIGISGQRIDHDVNGLFNRYVGYAPATAPFRTAHGEAFCHSPWTQDPTWETSGEDSSTPEAMAALIERLLDGQVLNPEHRALLETLMLACRTGEHRIRSLLPKHLRIAEKTGTLGGSINDVGVIALADGRRLVLAVFVAGVADHQAAEAAIASIAQAAWNAAATRPAP